MQKYSDDPTIIRWIADGQEGEYRGPMEVRWCRSNHLQNEETPSPVFFHRGLWRQSGPINPTAAG